MKKYLLLLLSSAVTLYAQPPSGNSTVYPIAGSSNSGSGQTAAQVTNIVNQNAIGLYTNPLIAYVRTNGNDSTAIIGRIDLAWATLTNAVTNLLAQVIDVGAGSFSISNKISPSKRTGIIVRGQGDATELQNWIILSNGIPLTLVDNCIFEKMRVTQMLSTTQNVFSAALGFNVSSGDISPTNSLARYITATNGHTDCLYYNPTNYFNVTIQDSSFLSRWDSGAILVGIGGGGAAGTGATNGVSTIQRCNFTSINQDPLNTAGFAHACWATGGSNNFDNCVFTVSGVPTNVLQASNNYALLLNDAIGSAVIQVTSCRFISSGIGSYDIANLPQAVGNLSSSANASGVTNQIGLFVVGASAFLSVTGPVQILSLPVTNGYVMVDNTNTLVVFASGQSDVNLYYTNSGVGNLAHAGVPGYSATDGSDAEVWRSTNVWKIVEPFGTVYYTNNATQPTNDASSGWKVFAGNGAATPVPTIRWDRYSTNLFNFTGNITLTNIAQYNYSNSWLTATNSRKTNLARRGTFEADFKFVDVVGGVPLLEVTVEDSAGVITNAWTCQITGGVTSTVTNHYSFRIPPSGIVSVTNKSIGVNGDAFIVQSRMVWE